MDPIVIIKPDSGSRADRLESLLGQLRMPEGAPCEVIEKAEELHPVRDSRILFALHLSSGGVNLEWIRMTEKIRRTPGFFAGCTGGVIVDGNSELYTKSAGREAVLTANLSGCMFPGRGLAEGTGSLQNYEVTSGNYSVSLEEAYRLSTSELWERVLSFQPPRWERPKLLVLHASIRETSNTLRLWGMIKEHLSDCMDIQEISLQNGEINDCIGCPFTTCMHFSSRGKCYYGGVVVEQVYPAMEECSGLVMLCPNYNDALSANISASINRLTSLYRRRQFFDKYLYGIVVSGYSGGDIVASQLISSLSLNKTFILPPQFAMMETANNPGAVLKIPGIEKKAELFAEQMKKQMVIERQTL